MPARTKTYPIVENALNLFGDWLKHRQEMREIREMDSGDFARIARDLNVSPADLDAVVRQGPHASDELSVLLKALGIDEATLSRTQPAPATRHGARLRCMPAKGPVQPRSRRRHPAYRYDEYCPNAPAIDDLGQKS